LSARIASFAFLRPFDSQRAGFDWHFDWQLLKRD
jgi:hypothetical protein